MTAGGDASAAPRHHKTGHAANPNSLFYPVI